MLPCLVGYGGIIRSFLAHRFWTPFARLTYAAYLYNVMVILTTYVNWPDNYSYSFTSAVFFLVSNVLISYGVSFLNFILLERPLINIEEELVKAMGVRLDRTTDKGYAKIDAAREFGE